MSDEEQAHIGGMDDDYKASLRLPAPARAPVKEYYGNRDTEKEGAAWLKKYDQIAKASGWPDSYAHLCFPVYLRGNAERWYDNLPDEVSNDWHKLRTAFVTEYRAFANTMQLRQELMNRKQLKAESASEFGAVIEELCRKVDPAMKEDEKMSYFLSNLRKDFKALVAAAEFSTLRQAIQRAQRIEALTRGTPDAYVLGDGAGGGDRPPPPPQPQASRQVQLQLEQQIQQMSQQINALAVQVAGSTPRRDRGQDHPRYSGGPRYGQGGEAATTPPRVQQTPTGVLYRSPYDARAPDVQVAGNTAAGPTEPSRQQQQGGASSVQPQGSSVHGYGLRSRMTHSAQTADVVCYNCRQPGHFAADCPHPRASTKIPQHAGTRRLVDQAASTLRQQGAADQQQPSGGSAGAYHRVNAVVLDEQQYSDESSDEEDAPVMAIHAAPAKTEEKKKDPAAEKRAHALLLQTEGTICGVPITMVVDTAAANTFISDKMYCRIPPTERARPLRHDTLQFSTAALSDRLLVRGIFNAAVKIGDVHMADDVSVRVVHNLACDMLLGCDFIRQHVAYIDVQRGQLVLREESVAFQPDEYSRGTTAPLHPYRQTMETPDDKERDETLSAVCSLFLERQPPAGNPGGDSADLDLDVAALPSYAQHLDAYERPAATAQDAIVAQIEAQLETVKASTVATANQLQEMHDLLVEYADVFAANPKSPGCVTSVEHIIDTGDAAPIKRKPYRTAPHLQKFLDEEIDGLLKNNIIVPSSAAWASPVVLVPKKDGSTRRVSTTVR